MEEDEYIQLDTLLSKLRVLYLKRYADIGLKTNERQNNLLLIRKVDSLRKNIPLKLSDVTIKDEREQDIYMQGYNQAYKDLGN